MKRHVILIGLSGSGKSVVGRALAGLLECPFRDLDDDIAVQAGASVAAIFGRDGEVGFRALEHAAMERALAEPPHVIASGGGWAAQPGNLERVRNVGFVIYLQCAPETAARRVGDAESRPLLAGDTLSALRRQLEARRRFYERADAVIEATSGNPDEVASAAAALARSSGGW